MSRMRCTKKRVFMLRHNTERDEQTYIQTDRQTDRQTLLVLRSRLREPPSAVIRAPPVQLWWSAPILYRTDVHTYIHTDTSGPKITFERASLLRYTGSVQLRWSAPFIDHAPESPPCRWQDGVSNTHAS